MSDLPPVVTISHQPVLVDRFIAAFGEIGLIGEEIADVIWLALKIQQYEQLPPPEENSLKESERKKSSNSSPNPINSDKPIDPSPPPVPSPAPLPPDPSSQAEIHPSEEQPGGNRDMPIRLPDARSLQEPLTIARALRPLFRRVPSLNMVLDEAATIERIAEEELWTPVLKPDLEPWLELALVVDESNSMLLWQRTIRELQRLLERYGIFRDVRTWGMVIERVIDKKGQVQEHVRIRPGIGKAARNQRTHSPGELIDPQGRRLVLIATDCVAAHWHDGTVLSALRTWSQSGSTAIIQMLPEWLWSRTALGLAAPVRFQSLFPGLPSQRLQAKPLSAWDEIDCETGIQVPIVTLEPEMFTVWSQLVAGKGGVWAPGFVFEPELFEPNEEEENRSDNDISAEQRVRQFYNSASPMAWKLACLLAAAPIINLPVVRIIQHKKLPKSRQVHTAEVFLGGLLSPSPSLSEITPDTNPDTIRYVFVDGVREALLESSLRSESINVFEVVSQYITGRKTTQEFIAYLKDPKQIKDGELQSHPIAQISVQILKQLGGEYGRYAEQLEGVDEPSANQETVLPHDSIEQDQIGRLLTHIWICDSSFLAHENNITCVCFSPDSRLIASSSDDLTIRLWDLEGNQIAKFVGHKDFVRHLAFSPDGQLIASASSDKTICLWDLQGNLLGQPFQGHSKAITSVAFSPDGRLIVSGSDDKTLRLWNLEGNLLGQPFSGHQGVVTSVTFKGDGLTIVSGGDDGIIRLWDLQGNSIYRLLHEVSVTSVASSWDPQQIIASGGVDGSLCLWEAQGNLIRQPIKAHTDIIYSIDFSPDGEFIASCGRDRTIRVWNRNGTPIGQPLQGHEGGVNSVAFSLDGQMLVSCGYDRSIKLWKRQEAEVTAVEPEILSLPFLDEPGGQVPLDSIFYMERSPIEARCYEAIAKPGAMIRIKAPRQMGKSSLMQRILNHAKQSKQRTAYISFQSADAEFLNNLDLLLPWFCSSISNQLGLDDRLEHFWKGVLGSKNKCTNYFQRYLLTTITEPLTLGLDEFDQVLQYPNVAQDFLGLLRSWYERGKNEPLWQKLRLVVVHSTEIYIAMNLNQSPFNVGLPIELSEFSPKDVQELAQRHELRWDLTQVEQLMQMTGGHPYLVRVALYHIARGEVLLEQFLQTAPTESGAYGDHLRGHLLNLESNKRLLAAMKQVIAVDQPVFIAAEEAFKLVSMGLVQQRGREVLPACGLYRLYFRERLATLDKSDTIFDTKVPSLEAEFKAALAIVDEQERTETLAHLIARSSDVPSTLLQIVSTIESQEERILALITLIPHLPNTLLSNALEIVKTIQDVFSRFQGLVILAVLLPEVVPEALQTGLEIEDESTQLRALTSIVEKLPPKLLPRALEAAQEIENEYSRANVLSALAEKLPPELLPEALAAARAIQDEYSRANALNALAEKLPEALAAAKAIQDEDSRAHVLRKLVPHLPSELLPHALDLALAIEQEAVRNDLLKDLIPFMPENLRQRINLVTETPSRTSLWQKGNTQIYALCTSTPWNLPLDALVIPVGYRGGLGKLAAAFQDFLGMNSRWLSQAISDTMEANKMKRIKPDRPLLVRLPPEISVQISSLTGFSSERFIICATSESEDELSVANTSIAYEAVIRLAVDQKFRRIIIPLIGTGINSLPVDEVATGMVRAINNALKSLQPTPLEEITIFDCDEDKISAIVLMDAQK